ncbi:MAG TPA: glycosyltransferase family 2 protein [Leptospiraceae bacterium]|nr:glycosyltransferase family 2 protein [Leptospiraceae bacterium]HMW04642.1 glycosyltransferase family 2 protein [Leptospiraceae bacterium]HMX31637.1 glycosyltransferase family 2 protein [Leptospiraceae bacterium]HMY30478.1 glycosyltransferase family 2 protein [Leptospiraceae bacterium]HMZ67311.1 glycosyltransferase family 2 protein [Leptospiraceae bacterium]
MTQLSIITINLNNKEGLQKTIDSVLNQTFRNFEFIVIDGGSVDGSLELIDKYKNEFAYWISEKDNGIYDAQNKGIVKAKGEYCLFLNSGDFLIQNDVLQKVFERGFETDIIYGDMLIDYGKDTVLYGKSPDKLTLYFLAYEVLWHCVTLIRRNLFDRYGLYDSSYKIVADVDFFLKAIGVGKASYSYINLPISQFNTAGFGSDPKNANLLEKERIQSRETVLSPLILETLKENREMKSELHIYRNSKSLKLINRIRENWFVSQILSLLKR